MTRFYHSGFPGYFEAQSTFKDVPAECNHDNREGGGTGEA